MKNLILTLTAVFFLFSIWGCKSTEQEETQPEKKIEAPETPAETPTPPAPPVEEDSEYKRSIGTEKDISFDTFSTDKAAIIKKISELNVIMANKDYNSWLKYIDPASREYWSQASHLAKASEKLPKNLKGTGTKLRTLQDYFTYVFIPARRGRQIDEIRYNSKDSIKAVQVSQKDDGTRGIIIYYNFTKQDGDWKVYIPEL
ncbi:MAG: hypothetical protein K2N58_10610 [Treponemataceae bacterium]|nr:hypothetical protein [Treponemataceae bacterium]